MSEPSVIVWDLETVPDLKAAARMLGMDGKPDEKVREALGSGFPKHPLHSIACIGALVAKRETEGWRVSAIGAPHSYERPEPELIRRSCHVNSRTTQCADASAIGVTLRRSPQPTRGLLRRGRFEALSGG